MSAARYGYNDYGLAVQLGANNQVPACAQKRQSYESSRLFSHTSCRRYHILDINKMAYSYMSSLSRMQTNPMLKQNSKHSRRIGAASRKEQHRLEQCSCIVGSNGSRYQSPAEPGVSQVGGLTMGSFSFHSAAIRTQQHAGHQP